jgi:hypothetical protein
MTERPLFDDAELIEDEIDPLAAVTFTPRLTVSEAKARKQERIRSLNAKGLTVRDGPNGLTVFRW